MRSKNNSEPYSDRLEVLDFFPKDDGSSGCGCLTLIVIVVVILVICVSLNKDYSPYPPTETAASLQDERIYVEITGDVNLRKSIGTDSPVLIVIPKGTNLYCSEKKTTSGGYVWYKASYKGQTGWFYGRYARELPG